MDTAEKIDGSLPELDLMIGGGLITIERAQVVIYRNDPSREERA